jgi:hypothetical protein
LKIYTTTVIALLVLNSRKDKILSDVLESENLLALNEI